MHRGQDTKSSQNGVWLMIRYTHTCRSRHFILRCFKGDNDRETKGPRTQPGALHTLIRDCATWRFMKKSERPGELQLEPLNAWNFDAQGYISQLRLRSSIARSIKRLHVKRPLQHHTRSQVSLVRRCRKYWLYVSIRLPLRRKTDV